MSYIRQIEPGKKVTVNANKTGYAPNSIVINPMPAQNITRQIFLTRTGVTAKVIYGPNAENPGEELLTYYGIITPSQNSQLFINNNSVSVIHTYSYNDKFPEFNTQGNPFVIMVGDTDYSRLFTIDTTGKLYYVKTMPRNVYENIINNTELEIVLYKAILGVMKFFLNGVEVSVPYSQYKLIDFYCSEIGDYIGDYAKLMGLVDGSIVVNKYTYMIGYTYTFILEDPQGNTITRNIQINPSQQQLQDKSFDIIINLDD